MPWGRDRRSVPGSRRRARGCASTARRRCRTGPRSNRSGRARPRRSARSGRCAARPPLAAIRSAARSTSGASDADVKDPVFQYSKLPHAARCAAQELEQLERDAVGARQVGAWPNAPKPGPKHVRGDDAAVALVDAHLAPARRSARSRARRGTSATRSSRSVTVMPMWAIARGRGHPRVDAAPAQRRAQLGGRHVVGDHRLADVDGQHEAVASRRGSAGSARWPRAAAARRPRAGSSRGAWSAGPPAGAARASARAVGRDSSPRAAAICASTAIPKATASPCSSGAVRGDRLERVGERVPEAERAARVQLVGVARDQLGLDRARAVHEPLERVEVAREDRRPRRARSGPSTRATR